MKKVLCVILLLVGCTAFAPTQNQLAACIAAQPVANTTNDKLLTCAEVAKPTTQDKLGYAYAGVAGVYKAIASAATHAQMGKLEGQKLIERTDLVKAALDTASSALGAGKADTAKATLDAALAALTSLEATVGKGQ
jgi:hypothetical protein